MSNILVIGGTSGIGKATAELLVELGHDVFDPRKEDCDVRVSTSLKSAIDYSNNEVWGENGLDAIVYSAGVNRLDPIGDIHWPEAMDLYQVNVIGFMQMLDHWVDEFDRPIPIVAVGSDAAERPMRTSMAYCSSKAALHMAVRCAARELGGRGYRINCVAPGMTDETGMQEYVDEAVQKVRGWSYEEMRAYEAQQEVVPGRIHVDEVAATIVNTLFGPPHLNGSIITINGGR